MSACNIKMKLELLKRPVISEENENDLVPIVGVPASARDKAPGALQFEGRLLGALYLTALQMSSIAE